MSEYLFAKFKLILFIFYKLLTKISTSNNILFEKSDVRKKFSIINLDCCSSEDVALERFWKRKSIKKIEWKGNYINWVEKMFWYESI